jgi:uncharacterized membrane protein
MESKIKLLGHAIHPMLIVFPLGLLATSFIFDIIRLISGNPLFSQIAFADMAAGIIGGLLAAIFGLLDWLALPGGTRAKTVGLYHGGGNVVVVVLFIISWLLRYGKPSEPPGFAVFLSLLAVLIALVTAWLGGELVERLRVGVDDGAHLDAPNSISGRPASGRAEARRT